MANGRTDVLKKETDTTAGLFRWSAGSTTLVRTPVTFNWQTLFADEGASAWGAA